MIEEKTDPPAVPEAQAPAAPQPTALKPALPKPPLPKPPLPKPLLPKPLAKEIGGAPGPEPTRYGDWQHKGRVTDF